MGAQRGVEVSVDDLIKDAYWANAREAFHSLVGVSMSAPDRKLAKALAGFLLPPDTHERVASSFGFVQASIRAAARARGVGVLDAVNGLSDEQWADLEASCLRWWPSWFVEHNPGLGLDSDRLMAFTLLKGLELAEIPLRQAREWVSRAVADARDGDVRPFGVVSVERALGRYGIASAEVVMCEEVLGDGHAAVAEARARVFGGMQALGDDIEELRDFWEQAGIPHEHVIGERY